MTDQSLAIAERLATIAAELAEVATRLSLSQRGAEGEPAPVRAARLLAERRALRRCLPGPAATEPAWAMLLALFVAADTGGALSAKALAIAADEPPSTAQRWLDQLAAAGLVSRVVDSADRRRVALRLTAGGRALVIRGLAALAPAAGSG